MLKNNKGITLIALVITIIVLLILAGVSIAMLTGENGILSQATDARDKTANAEAVERINLALNAAYSAALEPTPVAPTEENVKAHDGIFTESGTKYAVSDKGTSIEIKYTNGSTTITGSILKASPYTITPAKLPADATE